MQLRRNTNLDKVQVVTIAGVYCIQLKEVLSSSWQGFFKGLELQTVTHGGREVTIMKGSYKSRDEFQKILKQLEEMNLHYQKITVSAITESPKNSSSSLSTHTWIHEPSRL